MESLCGGLTVIEPTASMMVESAQETYVPVIFIIIAIKSKDSREFIGCCTDFPIQWIQYFPKRLARFQEGRSRSLRSLTYDTVLLPNRSANSVRRSSFQ